VASAGSSSSPRPPSTPATTGGPRPCWTTPSSSTPTTTEPDRSTQAVLAQLTPTQLFDSLAISVNGPDAWDIQLSLDVTFSDIGTNYRLTLRNGVLIPLERPVDDTADATVTVTKARMLRFLAGDTSSPGIDIAGDTAVLDLLLCVLEKGDPDFNIVTP
jgi:alkyl sulfatase BDS1-like metallo-beta-lactamase superfamily hydrolase